MTHLAQASKPTIHPFTKIKHKDLDLTDFLLYRV